MDHTYGLTTKYKVYLIMTLFFAILLIACKPSPSSQEDQTVSNPTEIHTETNLNGDQALVTLFADQLWQQGLKTLETVQSESALLQNKVNTLLDQPNDTTLSSAHAQWETTFLLYQQLLPFLFIEHASLTSSLKEWRLTLAAWPLQPGYLDSYGIYIHSGIVNDITLPITAESLRKQDGLTDPEEVTLGLYAIEYLLWGDKESSSPKRFFAQNKVPLVFEQAGLKVNELPNNRRRQLLALQTKLFNDDLSLLKEYWQDKGLFGKLFTKLTVNEKLSAFHNGLLTLLNEIETLLVYSVDINESETTQKNTYPERFNKNRQHAIEKQLASIESFYFANSSIDNTLSLAGILLSQIEQEALKVKIEGIKKQLTK